MKRDRGHMKEKEQGLPEPSFAELRGRQSVRATFKLTERAIDAISVLSVHLGIKQKSLFDHLLADLDSLRVIAEKARRIEVEPAKKVQKTFVISRNTLACLEKVSKNSDTPRDALVEISVHRLLPLIEQERERHRRRFEILKEVNEYLNMGEKLVLKARKALGEDDYLSAELTSALEGLRRTHAHMLSLVEKGRGIEDF
jgi:predicted transcriptional regulator